MLLSRGILQPSIKFLLSPILHARLRLTVSISVQFLSSSGSCTSFPSDILYIISTLMLLLSCLILHSVPGHFQSKTPFTLLRPAWSLEAKASPLRPSNRYTTFYCFVRGLNQLSWALQLDLPHCRFRENMHIPLKHKATKKWVLHQGRWK